MVRLPASGEEPGHVASPRAASSPHLRLPAERARIRGDARAGGRGRARRRGPGQHLRGHRRGGAAGAAGDPPGAARASGGADRRLRLRGADRRRRASPTMPEVDLVLGNDEKLQCRELPRLPASSARPARCASTTSCRSRETAGHLIEGMDGRTRGPSSRCRTAATIAAPSASSPMAAGNSRSVPMGAVVEQIRQLVENGYREVVLTGVDITAYGADLPGRAEPRQARPRHPPPRAGAEAPPPLLDRLDRGRRRAARG